MPRVRELEFFRVVLPYGKRVESLLVKLTEYGGMTGWGETVEPRDPPLESALPGLVWEHPDSVPFEHSAIDMAAWDLWTRMRGVPLAHALGGSRTSLMATVRLGVDAHPEQLVAKVNQQVCGGYRHVTLDIRPGWDVEPVRAVRQAFPALSVAVDAGESYATAEPLVALDSYGVEVIERPFPIAEISAHAALQERVGARVAVEGSLLEDYLTLDAARALILRPADYPRLSDARRAHDRAAAAGWGIISAGGRGTGLARAAAVAVASLPGCTLACDVTQPPRNAQIVSPVVGAAAGVVAVPFAHPGLGHEIDEERVRKLADWTESIRVPRSPR